MFSEIYSLSKSMLGNGRDGGRDLQDHFANREEAELGTFANEHSRTPLGKRKFFGMFICQCSKPWSPLGNVPDRLDSAAAHRVKLTYLPS